MFIDDFTPIESERLVTKILGLVIFLWAITSIFAAAFQCRPPEVWNSLAGECFNQVSLSYNTYLAVADSRGRRLSGATKQLLILPLMLA